MKWYVYCSSEAIIGLIKTSMLGSPMFLPTAQLVRWVGLKRQTTSTS